MQTTVKIARRVSKKGNEYYVFEVTCGDVKVDMFPNSADYQVIKAFMKLSASQK